MTPPPTTTTTGSSSGDAVLVNPDELRQLIRTFFAAVGRQEIEIYNEFSLQHEFGLFLRTHLANGIIKFQFERPTKDLGIKNRLRKKEIDLTCFQSPEKPLAAIEFKFPRAKQVPIRMFKYCEDVAFLEDLVIKEQRFGFGAAVMAADNRDFYQGSRHEQGTIYSIFRDGAPMRGTIEKPTGTPEPPVTLLREYKVEWHEVGGMPGLRYTMTAVTR